MRKTVLLIFTLVATILKIYAQKNVTVQTLPIMSNNGFYEKNSPLDYLKQLKDDFNKKEGLNVFILSPSPDNWIKPEHLEELMKLILSNDSTKSVMSIFSSYLPDDKFSSVGREAQNLLNCYIEKANYPESLNSFGPPDIDQAKRLEIWWAKRKAEIR